MGDLPEPVVAVGDGGGTPSEEVAAETPAADDVRVREFKCFWFHLPNGQKFTHLDLTGREALALEERFPGVSWGELRPSILAQRMAVLETFLARTDPDGAVKTVEEMTIQQLEDAVTMEFLPAEDDLPDSYVDGLPKATGAP